VVIEDRFGFPSHGVTDRLVSLALEEDLPGGMDLPSCGLFEATTLSKGMFQAKAEGVFAGGTLIERIYDRFADGAVIVEILVGEGQRVKEYQPIARVEGPIRTLLSAERTILNLLMRLSGIATMTSSYVKAVSGTGCRIVDTRKTTPGLRALEKYAVRAGGGMNHRMSLSDGVLVKDNHLAACANPGEELARLKTRIPHTVKMEVEVTHLEQARMAVRAGADILLLDNMTPAEMSGVVAEFKGRVVLEASGGITLDTVATVAAIGVDVISVGALTHSVKALDLSFELV